MQHRSDIFTTTAALLFVWFYVQRSTSVFVLISSPPVSDSPQRRQKGTRANTCSAVGIPRPSWHRLDTTSTHRRHELISSLCRDAGKRSESQLLAGEIYRKRLAADWNRTCFQGPVSLNRKAELLLCYTSVWRQGGFVLFIVQSLFSMLFWPIEVSWWIL